MRNIVRWVADKAFAAVRIFGVSKANRPLIHRYSSPESIVIDANAGLTVLARLSRESDNIVVVTVVASIPTADSVIIPKMMATARLDQEGDMRPSISMSRSTEESRGLALLIQERGTYYNKGRG